MHLYKLRSFDRLDWILDILLNERLFCAEYRDLNDPFEGIFISVMQHPVPKLECDVVENPMKVSSEPRSLTQAQTVRRRVCSLSEKVDDIMQWSFYGGGHKGLAIEIDFSGHEQDALPVIYGRLPRFFSEPHPDVGHDVLRFKTRQWLWEQERRILGAEEYYPICGRIRRIVLGVRTSAENEALLRKAIPRSIEVVRAALNFDSMKIELPNS